MLYLGFKHYFHFQRAGTLFQTGLVKLVLLAFLDGMQDPLRGDTDKLLQDILAVIHTGDMVTLARDEEAPLSRRLVPELMLKMAHKISPF